jgi:antitoxin PrlF
MATTSSRISEKGQVTIPKTLREALGIRAGDRLEFELRGDAIRIRKQPNLDRLASLYGSVKLPAPVDELIDEMRGGPPPPDL